MTIVTNGERTPMADRAPLTRADFDAFADELATLLDNAGWMGIQITADAGSAVVEGPLDGDTVRLQMAPGACGVAEGWHVSNTTRTPREG